jgi:sialic acid synthase SpsE
MRTEIIAEAAQGYEGDPTIALLLARAAARAGADAVKYQLVYADELATPDYAHYGLFRRLEMSSDAWKRVSDQAHDDGLKLYFDIFGDRSLREAEGYRADGVKVHTTDFFNESLVRAALDAMPRVLIAFGGITLDELSSFLDLHGIGKASPTCLMYGFQADPTPVSSNNLRRLRTLRARFPEVAFGFMGHPEASDDGANMLEVAALTLGVECIEKHLTLDRVVELEDHVSALTPAEFREFSQRLRNVESALGSDDATPTAEETLYRKKAVKVVVASRSLTAEQVLGRDDIALKRTADQDTDVGFVRAEDVIGRTISVSIGENQPLLKEMLR